MFLDPPYDRETEYELALNILAGQPLKLVIVQHFVRFALAESYGVLKRTRTLKQGDNALSFYMLRSERILIRLNSEVLYGHADNYNIRSSTGAPTPHPSIFAADAWLDEISR